MLLKFALYFLCFFASIIFQTHGQMSFVLKSYTVSPNYAKSVNSLYTFPFNAYNTVRGVMNLRVDFPNRYQLTGVLNCQIKIDSSIVTGTSCSFDQSTNQVVINNIAILATFSVLDVQFRTGTSKYSATTTVQFIFMNATTSSLITNNSELVKIQNAALACTFSSNSTVVGASSTYSIQFEPSVEIQANSVVQLQLDTWGPFNRSNFLSSNTANVCAGLCTINLISISRLELLIFSSLFSSATNNSRTINLNNARNPSSFAPIRLTVTVSASDSTSVYMIGSTTFSASSTNTFTSIIFDNLNKGISATNPNINLRISPRNPINWNTYLRIIFSSDVSVSYLFAFNSLLTTPNQISGQTSGYIMLGNLTRTTITSEPTLLSLGNFTLINPPYSQKGATVTFRTEQLVNAVYYFIDESTLQIVANPSTIAQSGIKPSVLNIGSVTTYVIWFVTVNRLGTDSFILVSFPAQIKLNQVQSICTLTNSGINSACSVNSSTSIKILLDSTVSTGTNLTITVSKITNPLTTVPTTSFILRTFFMDDLSLVDQLNAGLTFTATQTPLRSVIVTPSSYKVFNKAIYTFLIQSSYQIPTSSVIKIGFPSLISQGGQVLQAFLIDGSPVSGCIFSFINSTYLQLSNLCIKSSIANSSTISIILSNITNPTSFKPTNSFVVQVFNGIYKQEFLNSGIFVTMNQTAAISYFKATPTSSIVNQVTLYSFDINFLIKHFSGDRVLIKFPTEVIFYIKQVQISSVFDCASLTTNLTISCSKINSETMQFILNYNSSIYSNQATITVQNFTNNWYSSTRTFTVQTTTNDTSFYYQEEGSSIVNYLPAKILCQINNDNRIVLLGESKLTLGLTSSFALSKATNTSLLFIVIQVPTDLVPKQNTCIPSYGSSVCTQSSTQVYNITNIGDFSSTLNVRFNAQTSFFDSSSSFDIKLYYGSNLIQLNSELKAQKYCQSPCKECTTTKTQCLSCLPSPYAAETIYFSFNSSCLNSCPETYFLITASLNCGQCNSTACKNCQNTANQCTSCQPGKFLSNKICLSVCPNGFYAFNGQCLVCSSPCSTCIGSATTCLSCVATYFLDIGSNTSRCVKVCTNTNYLGVGGQCMQCTQNCLRCSFSLGNCTACDQTTYRLYLNSCVRNCPVGLYSNASGSCVNCESPCLTCSTRLTCQSCVSTFYLYNGSNCIKQCPNGFIEVVNECQTCSSKCATCQGTAANCTSCSSGKLLYQFDCYSECPALTYPYNKTCTRCISPCVTCSTSPELCLSCIDGLYLLNATCVNGCPLLGYILEGKTCLSCPSNCITCSNSINCVLCSNNYFLLQGSCISVCPVNYPIVENRQCYQCESVCLTCSTSKWNCTSCKINLFKNLYTCVSSCPIGFYTNTQNHECEDGLNNKIVFFPLLILSIVIIAFIVVVKCINTGTSLATSLTAVLSLTEIAIWIFIAVELAEPIKQLDVQYNLPIAMVAIALTALVAQNIAYFILEMRKMENDDYARGWASNNVNYTVLTINRYVALIINFKFFRLVYSRFFNLRTLSLPFKNTQNIFPLTTVFSIFNFVLCQIPMMVGTFSLIYKKVLKDQLFYTSVECLIITITCAVLLLIDIFKSEEYFQESDYVKTRKYLQKIKDASFNQLQDNFDISKDEGSMEGQKYVSKTGGKFIFSKQNPSSIKQLFFQQEVGSTITDGEQSIRTKGYSQRMGKRINIFDPIKQEDEELYEDIKYKENQIKTQLQMQRQKNQSINQYKDSENCIQQNDQKSRRGLQLGVSAEESNWDDNVSMIEQRPLRKKWNNIITHRQRLAKSIFNTIDEYSTKQLQKIIEPLNQDDYDNEQDRKRMQDPFRTTEYDKPRKNKRRRRKQAPHSGNNELQKIYLQRLTEKKTYKDIFASSQSIKYDF